MTEPATPLQNHTLHQINEAQRREKIVQAALALMGLGKSMSESARSTGADPATLSRWLRAYKDKGFNGLIPETANCGRKSFFQKLELSADEVKRVKGLHLDTKSNTTAWRLYAQSDECREEVADAILKPRRSKHSIPPSLRRATKLTPAEEMAHRGPRALDIKGMYIPRKLDIIPGDIFSSDDTTPIWAWWVPWFKSKEYPYGKKVLQGQLLPVFDIASQALINFVIIAREASSYRASDIWALFGHTFDQVGLPRLGFQLERGSWEANLIRGESVEYRDGEATHERRLGGLRMLPTNVTDWHRQKLEAMQVFPKTLQTWTSYNPKSKSIEAFFDRSQTLEGTIWGSLGRDQMRKPFEKTKKIYEACKRGAADPSLHFLSWMEMVNRLKALFEYINNEPIEGEVFHGRPGQLWNEWTNKPGYELQRLPESSRWLYRRDWKATRIQGPWVRVRLTDELTGRRYSLFYENPAAFAPHDGESIVVYYDREEFESPAQVILARTGEHLCEANYFDRRGSFLEGDCSGHDIRKEWKNAVMAAYGSVVQYAPSRQVPTGIMARREAARRESSEGLSGELTRMEMPNRDGVRLSARAGAAQSSADIDERLQEAEATEAKLREEGQI